MTARELWEEFALAVVPVDSPPAQRKEMRRAFYAGFSAMMCIARSVGDDDMPEAVGVELLKKLWGEVHAFAEAVKRGEV